MRTRLRRLLKRHTDPWIARQYGDNAGLLVHKFPRARVALQKAHHLSLHVRRKWRTHPHRHRITRLSAFPIAVLLAATLMVPIALSTYRAPEPDGDTLDQALALHTSIPEPSPIPSTPEEKTADDPNDKSTTQAAIARPRGEVGKVENAASGYQFYYPYGLRLDTDTAEPGSWSTVTLTSPDHAGRIVVAVYTTSLSDWLATAGPMNTLSTTLGGLPATKALLPGPQTAIAVERFGNVYVISLKDAGDNPFWTDAYRTATSTFSFASFGYSQQEINERFSGVQ